MKRRSFPGATPRSLELRGQLVRRIARFYRASGMSRSRAARLLHIPPARLDALLSGRISAFTLDALTMMLSRAGFEVQLVIN